MHYEKKRYIRNLLCALFGHPHALTHIENGPGGDFRYVGYCYCAKEQNIGPWTDDNHLLGYGKDPSA